MIQQGSAYWLKNQDPQQSHFNLLQLASTQRAITNQVKILTGREIPVDFVDDVVTVATECAKNTAHHLARKYGLFVGISSGANVNAAFKWLRDNDKRHAITFLCDRGERYFSCL